MDILMDTTQRNSHSLNKHWMWITPALLVCLQIIVSQYNFLLFHTVSELFSISIAITLGVVAWHMFPLTRNNYLLFLGLGYLGVASLDLMHALSYKGLGILPVTNHDLASQFWVTSRYLEALILLLSPLFLTRAVKVHYLVIAITLCVSAAIYAIIKGIFPYTFVYGEGLTTFKIISEYIIIAVVMLAAYLTHTRKRYIEEYIYKLIIISMVLTACAELFFTFYTSVYGVSNIAGHIFKMLSFWLIFVAVIHTTLFKPFIAMARSVSTYDAIPYAALVIDNHGIIRQANPAAEKLAHKAQHELIGEHCHALFHNPDISFKTCSICKKIKDNEAITLTKETVNHKKIYELSLSPAGYHDNAFGLVHTIRDITKQHDTEHEIRESQEYNRMLFEYSPLGQSLCTSSEEIVDANTAYASTVGYSVQELIGMSHDKLSSTDTPEMQQQKMESLLLTGKYGPIEKTLINKEGKAINVRMRGMLLQRNDAPLIWSSIENIQEEKKNQEVLMRFRQALDNVNEKIFIIDPSTMLFTDTNNTARNRLGYDEDELLSLGLQDILASNNKTSLRQIYEHLCAEEIDSYDIIADQINKNGMHIQVSVRLSAQRGDNQDSIIIAIIREAE